MEIEFEVTRESFKNIVEMSRKLTGAKMYEMAQMHLEEYPECEREQIFIDGLWVGIKLAVSLMQQADDLGDDEEMAEEEEQQAKMREKIDEINRQICDPSIPIEDIVDKFTDCKTPELRAELIERMKKMREERLK